MPQTLWESWLKPIPLQALVVERGKQWGLAEILLPEAFSPGHLSQKYPFYEDAGAFPVSPTRPGAPGFESKGKYSETTITGEELRIAVYIDDWKQKWSSFDIGKNDINQAVDTIMRYRESRVFTHLADTSTYSTMGTTTKTDTYWDDATDSTARTNILHDIAVAKKDILDNAHVVPDTLVIGTDVEQAFMDNASLMEVMYWAGQGNLIGQGISQANNNGQGLTGWMLEGLQIAVTHAKSQNKIGTETALVSDVAWVMKRGDMSGIIHTPERLTSEIEGRENRAEKVNVFSTFEAHIIRPRNIHYISNVIT